jgi:hypothetical protein
MVSILLVKVGYHDDAWVLTRDLHASQVLPGLIQPMIVILV